MVSQKKASKKRPQAPSNLSSKVTVAASPSSALIATAFSPPQLRLSLFASVVLGLDAYRLRIHDANAGRLCAEHILDKGVTVNSLAWGILPSREKKGAKKKRRRIADSAAGDDVGEEYKSALLALATNRKGVLLFSPREGSVVGALEGEHIGAVRHFAFSEGEEEGRGWSCGVDGKLVQWDVGRRVSLSVTTLPETSIQRVAPLDSKVLCASNTIYAIDRLNPGIEQPSTFTASTTPIHALVASGKGDWLLSAAEADRFINIFSLEQGKQVGALVADSDVRKVSALKGRVDEVLAVVTAEGIVEVFKAPFELPGTSATASPTTSRKKRSFTKKAAAKVKIARPDKRESVMVVDASVHDEDLIVVWVEGGVNVEFEKIRWADPEDGRFVLEGQVDITRAKTSIFAADMNGNGLNGVKDVSKMSIDQAQAVIVSGGDMQDVGMEDFDATLAAELSTDEESGYSASEAEQSVSDGEQQPPEPSFAERFQALEVTAKPSAQHSTPGSLLLQTPTAGALTTVLMQALQTNDTALLESCFDTQDSHAICNTVRKLPSPMAVTLLERLAERLARKPGRAGALGEWVRWTLVAHGGYLITLPSLMRTVSPLHSTLAARAGALPRLYALQGRLDMLKSQVELRKDIRANIVANNADDRDVLYIEGETKESDESEEESEAEPEEVGMEGIQIEDVSYIKSPAPIVGKDEEEAEEEDIRGSSAEEEFLETDEDQEDSEMDESEREREENAFLDIEASESEGEEEDADSVDYDDMDAMSEDEEEEGGPVVRERKGRSKR